jgi:hypothetical protein
MVSWRKVSDPRADALVPARVSTTEGEWRDFTKVCIDRGVTVREALGNLVHKAIDDPFLVTK